VKFGFAFYLFEGFKSNLQVRNADVFAHVSSACAVRAGRNREIYFA